MTDPREQAWNYGDWKTKQREKKGREKGGHGSACNEAGGNDSVLPNVKRKYESMGCRSECPILKKQSNLPDGKGKNRSESQVLDDHSGICTFTFYVEIP